MKVFDGRGPNKAKLSGKWDAVQAARLAPGRNAGRFIDMHHAGQLAKSKGSKRVIYCK